ncbi:MAG: hypothetical protein KAT75_12205, partial [Dehalococcoidia bacterium]|nr:hypothetical protein [Dehalococcoidia bacterium]
LNCRWDSGCLKFFLLNQIPSLVLAFFGIVMAAILTGAWWALIVYAIACIALWVLGIETRILCSHCPYYAEDSKILHCYALHGSPKVWRYRPGPMNRAEKATIVLFFLFLVLFPVLIEAYGIWSLAVNYAEFGLIALLGMIALTLATIMAGLQFLYILIHDFCSKCVNFSCPLNRVPKSMVDVYLDKNPVMKEAWAKRGIPPSP